MPLGEGGEGACVGIVTIWGEKVSIIVFADSGSGVR
jgi:hypothetical protein